MKLIKDWWRLILCILCFSVGTTMMALSEDDSTVRKTGGILVLCTFAMPIYYIFVSIKEKQS
jgi:hypothetical protein